MHLKTAPLYPREHYWISQCLRILVPGRNAANLRRRRPNRALLVRSRSRVSTDDIGRISAFAEIRGKPCDKAVDNLVENDSAVALS
jgi:hypothetical protein